MKQSNQEEQVKKQQQTNKNKKQNTQIYQQKKKDIEKVGQFKDLMDNMKHNNIHAVGLPTGRRRER